MNVEILVANVYRFIIVSCTVDFCTLVFVETLYNKNNIGQSKVLELFIFARNKAG